MYMKAKLCKGIRLREDEFGGTVLIKRGGIQQVDRIGFEILFQIKIGTEIEKIVENMKNEYAGEPERIENDVHRFVEKLLEEGIIEIER